MAQRFNRRWAVSSGLALVAAAASPALAQDALLEAPRPRQGYYLAAGLSGMASQTIEDGTIIGMVPGFALGVSAGQLITERAGLGLTLDFGGGAEGEESVAMFQLGVEGQLEVAPNVAIHGGVGLGVVQVTGPDDDDGELRGAVGGAYTVGVSYDHFARTSRSGGLALSPRLALRAIPGEDDTYIALFGLDVTYWTGLDNNKLKLDGDAAYDN